MSGTGATDIPALYRSGYRNSRFSVIEPPPLQPHTPTRAASFYELQTKSLDGKAGNLAQYKGKVSLVVNVASKCGFTPQYEGLEKLQREMKAKGFNVLGFPSNDFGEQEPGSAQEIATFCRLTYDVTFPMFEKVVTRKGADQSPIYTYLGGSGKLGRQLKWAGDSGARWCLIYGDKEDQAGHVTVRDMVTGDQVPVPADELRGYLAEAAAATAS